MKTRTSFTIFSSVVYALFFREILTRFGSQKLGYFWAVFDAMLMVLIFAGLKSVIAENSMPGVDFPVFLATSFLAFFLWKNIVSRSMDAFNANQGLFHYKQVKPFDTIIARILVEVFVSLAATLVFIGIGVYFEFGIAVQDFPMVILCVIWLCLFAFSMGLMSAVFSYFFETYGKLLKIAMTPLLFVSALMYTVDSLPPLLRKIILYNPLVHFIEMLHGYYFEVLDTGYVNYEYMLYWTIIPLYIGLFFYRRSEKRILAS